MHFLFECIVSRFFRDRHVKKAHRVSPPRSMARSRKLHESKHKPKEGAEDMEVDEEDK